MSIPDPWPPSDQPERQKLLAQLAQLYFVDGASKVAIGKQTNLSRFQVASLIQEAQDTGIVRIEIVIPDNDQDAQLAHALGIDRVVTVGAGPWPADRHALARDTARVFMEQVEPGDVLGISWSRTLQLITRELPPLPHNQVIQLAGALSNEDSQAAPRLLADLTCQSAWPLWAPLIVDNASALMKSPEIAQTLNRANGLDVALIAIGGWSPELSTVWNRVSPQVADQARTAGAVAEISGHLLTADGTSVKSPVESMVVAASLEQIKNARITVAAAFDAGRAPAVQAAARAGLIDVLVCDEPLRHALAALVDHPEPTPASAG